MKGTFVRRACKLAAYSITLMVCASFPAAASISESVTIEKLHIRRSIGDLVFIEVSSPPQNRPACATAAPWHYVFSASNEAGKKLYGMLLAAAAAKTPIYIDGTNTCNEYSGIESLDGAFLR